MSIAENDNTWDSNVVMKNTHFLLSPYQIKYFGTSVNVVWHPSFYSVDPKATTLIIYYTCM